MTDKLQTISHEVRPDPNAPLDQEVLDSLSTLNTLSGLATRLRNISDKVLNQEECYCLASHIDDVVQLIKDHGGNWVQSFYDRARIFAFLK
jgi:hypothetical protein